MKGVLSVKKGGVKVSRRSVKVDRVPARGVKSAMTL
jgi:hypothetical protein